MALFRMKLKSVYTLLIELFLMTNLTYIRAGSSTEIYTQENCNTTLTGPSGIWKRVELITNPQSYRLWPFKCHITFRAEGGTLGDQLVHLSFEDLNLGATDKFCRRGSVSILDVDGPDPASDRIESSPPSTTALDPGSHYGSWSDASEVAGKFCWLARGRDGSPPSPFYSEHDTVRVMVRGNAWFDRYSSNTYPREEASTAPAPIRFALRYRFIPRDRAQGRYGSSGGPDTVSKGAVVRGSELPGTYCDRIYVDCKDCRVRSPGWPGTYLRNLTCRYYVLNKRNRGQRSHVSLRTGPGLKGGSGKLELPGPNWANRIRSGTEDLANGGGGGGLLFLNCLSDRIEIYDGSAPRADALIGTFCGHGVFPSIVSTKPDILVKFVSADLGALGLPGFELIANSVIGSEAHGSSLSELGPKHVLRNDCTFVINGSEGSNREGKFSSLQHWIRPNTTCDVKFVGRPLDKVFLIFHKFYINPTNEDGNDVSHDAGTLPIDDMYNDISGTSTSNCKRKVALSLGDSDNEVYKVTFCPGSSPYICPLSLSSGQSKERACEIGKESYLSVGNRAHISYHEPWGSYDGTNIMFEGRYEFVDTSIPVDSEHVPGTLCDLRFLQGAKINRTNGNSTDKTLHNDNETWNDFSTVSAPDNILLYGTGGRNHLRCVYEFVATQDYVVEVRVNKLAFGDISTSSFDGSTDQDGRGGHDGKYGKGCSHAFNHTTMAYECMSDNPRRNLRIVSGDGREIGCFCSTTETSSSLSHQSLIRRLSNPRLEFSLQGLRPWEGPDTLNFDISYRYVKKRDCEDKTVDTMSERGYIHGLVESSESNNSQTENGVVKDDENDKTSDLAIVPKYGGDTERSTSRVCSWKIKVNPREHIYLRFVRLNLNIDCDKEKILFYSLGSPKPFKTLCQSDHVDDRQVFSEGWYLYNNENIESIDPKNDLTSDQTLEDDSVRKNKGKKVIAPVSRSIKRYNTIIVELIYTVNSDGHNSYNQNKTRAEKFFATWIGIIKPPTNFILTEEVIDNSLNKRGRKFIRPKVPSISESNVKNNINCPFQCPGSCIAQNFVCDGTPDCPGNYDSTNSPDEREDMCKKYKRKSEKVKPNSQVGNGNGKDPKDSKKYLENDESNSSSNKSFHEPVVDTTNASSNNAVGGSGEFFDKLKKIPIWLYTVLVIIILTLLCSIVGFVIVLFVNSRNRRGAKSGILEKNGGDGSKNGKGSGNHHKRSIFSLWKLKPNRTQKYHQVSLVPAGALVDEIDMPPVSGETGLMTINGHGNGKKHAEIDGMNGFDKRPSTTIPQKDKPNTNGINHIKYRYFQGPVGNGSNKNKGSSNKSKINTVEV